VVNVVACTNIVPLLLVVMADVVRQHFFVLMTHFFMMVMIFGSVIDGC
jgi:hypothetical protein